ncbi:MAG: NADH:flavin oxidoreductase [Planctomycetota bacterium]|nr:MAG: NADH:flavin oxidoreductase [Planctomycetota bacterium]
MRTRHEIPAARWPSREEVAASRLYSPIRIGPIEARTRTWVPAMVPWRSTEDGHVTRDVLDWYGRFAEGRPGVLVVEATGIRDVPSGPLLRIGHDRFLPGLRELTRVVRERSSGATRLFIQTIDFLRIRRRPEKARFVREFLALRPVHRERASALPGCAHLLDADEQAFREALLALPHAALLGLLDEREVEALERGARERVSDVHLPHVAALPRVLPGLFADAAERARAAGFDGVELHYAHAYTMASFLSRLNERPDGYGGSREGRLRLPLEVFQAVRARVGEGFAVGCRLLGDEVIAGGSRIADAAYYATELARAGMDFVSTSKGGKFEDAKQPRVGEAAYPYTGPSGHECMPTVFADGPGPIGRNLPLSHAIRDAIRAAGLETPVIGAGGLNSFEIAEGALEHGDCDIVAAARQSLADPDWWRKLELGRGAEIRRCLYTNYCEGLDQRHKQVTCQLWDRDFAQADAHGRDGALARSRDGKRRLVAPPWGP